MSTSRFKLGALGVVAASAVLLPLYGGPAGGPVTHAEWGYMVVRALDLDDALTRPATASQVFGILSWRDTMSLAADAYVTGEAVRVEGAPPDRRVVGTAGVGQVTYAMGVVRSGDYTVRLKVAGAASAEIAPVGDDTRVQAFPVAATGATTPSWVEAGRVHLDPGAYEAAVLLPEGSALTRIEVAPPCLAPVEPPGGWRAAEILGTHDAAVTMVQALDEEDELPAAGEPVEADVTAFRLAASAGGAGSDLLAGAATGLDGLWMKAGPRGAQIVGLLDLPEDGLYTISVFGIAGGGQSWTADACRRTLVCPPRAADDLPRWHTVLSGRFEQGRHSFTATLAGGAALNRIRAQRKKESAADYADTLRRLGFDVGPDGPMPRDRARDAAAFLERGSLRLREGLCGEILLPDAPGALAGLQVAPLAQPQAPLAPGALPPGGVPVVPPGGPTPDVSPTPTAPPPSAPPPSAPPTAPPSAPPTDPPPTAPPPTPAPSPTPLPSPPILPSQPPTSPVQVISPTPPAPPQG